MTRGSNKNHKTKAPIILNIFIFALLIITMSLIPSGIFEDFLGIDLKKIIKIVIALASIQVLGFGLIKYLNSHAGVMIHGFLSGLISSTALTVTLAKKSNKMTSTQKSVESISFLSATLAMLCQGIFLAFVTVSNVPFKVIALFSIPIITTIALMIIRSIHTKDLKLPRDKAGFSWKSILRLSLFICVILGLSNHAKNLVGDAGLQVITFIISLFEAHGSIVASSQLFSSSSISETLYASLIALSILSSYVSKIAIVYMMGHKYLKIKITLWSLVVLSSLALGFFIL